MSGSEMFAIVALSLLAAGGLGVMVWALLGRSALAHRLAGLEVELAQARADRQRAEDELASVRGERDRLAALNAELSRDKAVVQTQLHAERERHERALVVERERAGAELLKEREILDAQRRAVQHSRDELKRELEAAHARLREAFGSLAGEALKHSSEEFLKLAQQKLAATSQTHDADLAKRQTAIDAMLKPMGETLKRTEEKLALFEQRRTETESRLGQQLETLGRASHEVRQEAGRLVKALREPHVRGRYGEIQLRRVAELAGMRAYCDFAEQDSTSDDEGNALRPDMIVRLPNERVLVVDAKANLKPYLDAIESEDPVQAEAHLDRFAEGVIEQARKLSKKSYYTRYDGSPDFVVMFLPGDQFVDAALSRRADLLEQAAGMNVLLASPSSLIAMLRAVHVGFQERLLSEQARQLTELVRELHARLATALSHVTNLGRSLGQAIEHYNRFEGSYARMVEPQVRKIEAAGIKSAKELPEIKPIEPRTGSAASAPLALGETIG